MGYLDLFAERLVAIDPKISNILYWLDSNQWDLVKFRYTQKTLQKKKKSTVKSLNSSSWKKFAGNKNQHLEEKDWIFSFKFMNDTTPQKYFLGKSEIGTLAVLTSQVKIESMALSRKMNDIRICPNGHNVKYSPPGQKWYYLMKFVAIRLWSTKKLPDGYIVSCQARSQELTWKQEGQSSSSGFKGSQRPALKRFSQYHPYR